MGKHATFCFRCWMQDRSVLSNWSSAVTFSRARLQKMVSKRRPPIRKLWRFLSLGWFKLLLAGNHCFSSSNQGVSSINVLSLTIEPIVGFWSYSRKSEWSLSPEQICISLTPENQNGQEDQPCVACYLAPLQEDAAEWSAEQQQALEKALQRQRFLGFSWAFCLWMLVTFIYFYFIIYIYRYHFVYCWRWDAFHFLGVAGRLSCPHVQIDVEHHDIRARHPATLDKNERWKLIAADVTCLHFQTSCFFFCIRPPADYWFGKMFFNLGCIMVYIYTYTYIHAYIYIYTHIYIYIYVVS